MAKLGGQNSERNDYVVCVWSLALFEKILFQNANGTILFNYSKTFLVKTMFKKQIVDDNFGKNAIKFDTIGNW